MDKRNFNTQNECVHVVNKKEQDAIAAVAAELVRNCKIDFYPEEGRIYVYYHGPNRFNIFQEELTVTKVKEVRR